MKTYSSFQASGFFLLCFVLGCGGRPLVEITISVPGDQMRYDTELLKVPANSHVKLTLVNKATLATMKHNLLIFDLQNQDRVKVLDRIGEMAAKMPESSGYVPSVPGLIAATPMALPGQTVSIEFDAPPAGEYLFMCTFQPAHYKMMNGKFIVE